MIDLIDFDVSIKDQMESIRIKSHNEYVNAKTFISGYMWGKPMGIKIHLEEDMYAVKNHRHGAKTWNFPVGEENQKIGFIRELIQINGLKLRLLTENDVNFLCEHFPELFTFEISEDESEYIYDSAEHANMAGGRFNSLRNRINKFNRQHTTKSVPLTKGDLPKAEKIMAIWEAVHGSRGELDMTGVEADKFIIKNYEELGLIGTLTYVDKRPAAVTIGYPIASDMCDVAEEKFIPTIDDIGYIAFEEFMKQYKSEYRYFNLEEDMGIQGLREQKKHLKPCRMNTFWNAYLKEVNNER